MIAQAALWDIEKYIKESNAIEGVYAFEEVAQSLTAWDYLMPIEELNKKIILEVHSRIMKRFNPKIAGKYRKIDVSVGRSKKMSWQNVISSLERQLTFKPYNGLSCLEWHLQFEEIHPFGYGNGRTGRMIYWWHCQRLGIVPILFTEKDKLGYYGLFR